MPQSKSKTFTFLTFSRIIAEAALHSPNRVDIAIDLTESEFNAVKGSPSEHGLCAYFPFGEYFIKKREVIRAEELPIDVANIKPGSPAATKPAHQHRLQADLPDPCDFGAEYNCKFGFKGEAARPQARTINPEAEKDA